MTKQYSVETCRLLTEMFERAELLRPMRAERYDAGDKLEFDVTGVVPARSGRVRLAVEKFVGGGFAGQVYRVRVLEMSCGEGEISGLAVCGVYAMKILVPPSWAAGKFRNAIYAAGFQGSFSLQVNPAAARAGALWQKFIRRCAKVRFGDERAVVDVLATFVDERLGSCGELSEWLDGRTWLFEVDDRLFRRWRWRVGEAADGLGSDEYCAKKTFMAEFVTLLHEMGAHEFARQYEWWTCKSQPNALKRLGGLAGPAGGLTAVDFRAGLALLPFLPMSPGDVKLIFAGLARGSLVQFDRGDLEKLRRFMDANGEAFADLREAFDELKGAEREYRDSLVDVTHHHVRLLYDGGLWRKILDSAVSSWRVRNITDDAADAALRRSRMRTVVFGLLGLVPFLGSAIRKLWGRGDYRRHLGRALSSLSYLRRAVRGHVAEALIGWHRAWRVSENKALKLAGRPWRFFLHWPLSFLPAGLHRFVTDWAFAREKLAYIFVRPVRLYFNADAREQWLHDMVAEGRANHMLTDEDAERILSRIKEPFIQKYLKSLAVHVCTLPITQIVSVIVAWVYVRTHPELSWEQATAAAAGILVAFQLIPISPGSLVRGLYVLYLVIRERNFRDYNIAVFLGFFKYVGYLAFPIQMAYHYPALARFMAAHWATGVVHIVPVFGERGALLEHAAFDIFYNYPLTIRRRMRARAEQRRKAAPQTWHVVPIAVLAAGLFAVADLLCRRTWGAPPTLWNIWPLTLLLPLAVGAAVTLAAGGAVLLRRVKLAMLAGAVAGLVYAVMHVSIGYFTGSGGAAEQIVQDAASVALWRVFLFTLLAAVGALLTEINLPEKR